MTIFTRMHNILKLLVDNLKNEQPQAVDAKTISEKLEMNLRETCQLIKMMHEKGLVESDQEGERVVVTRQGLLYAAEMELSHAA